MAYGPVLAAVVRLIEAPGGKIGATTVKDITSTTFGLLIAYLLPGLVGLYSLTFWSAAVEKLFATFLTAESNVGLFLLVVLAALIFGLQLTAFRWIVFEQLLSKSDRLSPGDFAELGSEGKLAAFQAAVDEHYRYHQFWGGLAIAMPLLYIGWLGESWSTLSSIAFYLSLITFIAVECLTGVVAVVALGRYASRAKRILKGA